MQTLVVHDTESWVKKAGSFDKPINCYDRAEMYELVDSSTLIKVGSTTNKFNIALYRDYSLEIFPNTS